MYFDKYASIIKDNIENIDFFFINAPYTIGPIAFI